MIDPRLIVHEPGTMLLPGMIALAQEMLDAGYATEDVDPWLNAATDWLAENTSKPLTEANIAAVLGLPAPTQAQIDEAKAAIAAAEGASPVADDAQIKQLLEQNALLTQAVKRILLGQYTGATGAAADVVALQGGTDDVSGKVRVPLYPQ